LKKGATKPPTQAVEYKAPHENKTTFDFISDASQRNQRLTVNEDNELDGRTEEFKGPGDARNVSPEKKSAEFGEP